MRGFPTPPMAEVIQFNCPVCGTTLRLPLVMAAARGPCPNCTREIVAPDPGRGSGAYEVSLSPPPEVIEPFRPFDGPPLLAPVEPESATVPVRKNPQPSGKPLRTVLLCCLLSGMLALVLGFVLGVQVTRKPPPPPPDIAPVRPTIPAEPAPPGSEPVQIRGKPIIGEATVEPPKVESKPESKPEPTQVAAAAEATLRAFLQAPDWASRSAYVLFPEKMRPAMEAYSRETPDGPTRFDSIAVKQTQIDEKTGYTLFIFFVSTDAYPGGIPVAVQETAGGWLVDWRAFVEFRDQLFQIFADGPVDQTGRFHLIASPPPPERAAKTENEHFISVMLNAPLNPTPRIAFVKKATEAFNTFQTATAGGGFFTPVLEVTKRKTTDGKTYLEVLRVVATDWIPKEY